MVCSYRDGEPRVRELARHFSGLARVGRRIALRGLSPEEVEAYVARVAGEGAARSLGPRLAASTGGNPFFLSELLRTIDAGADSVLRIPEEVRAVIRHRVDGLSPEAATLLQLASVGGRTLDLAVLERMSRLSPSLLVDAIGESVAAGVVVEDLDGIGPAFAHELVRATMYEDLEPPPPRAAPGDGHRPRGARPRGSRPPAVGDRPPPRLRRTARRRTQGRRLPGTGG